MKMADGSMALPTSADTTAIRLLAEELVDVASRCSPCVIAFSGGVDSAVVAKAAFLGLGQQATAATGIGAAVSQKDMADAREVAASIGILHVFVPTNEVANSDYQANDGRRCYFCKSELYRALMQWGKNRFGKESVTILSGTNADDLGDYRPGIQAGREHGVQTPLADLGLRKKTIRDLAAFWQLPIFDKPASPCLASRIAYGEMVTEPRLRRIELAEAWLHSEGFADCRVRLHPGNLARIEVHQAEQLVELNHRRCRLVEEFRALGFDYVTLDLSGRESGSLNRHLSDK